MNKSNFIRMYQYDVRRFIDNSVVASFMGRHVHQMTTFSVRVTAAVLALRHSNVVNLCPRVLANC